MVQLDTYSRLGIPKLHHLPSSLTIAEDKAEEGKDGLYPSPGRSNIVVVIIAECTSIYLLLHCTLYSVHCTLYITIIYLQTITLTLQFHVAINRTT